MGKKVFLKRKFKDYLNTDFTIPVMFKWLLALKYTGY